MQYIIVDKLNFDIKETWCSLIIMKDVKFVIHKTFSRVWKSEPIWKTNGKYDVSPLSSITG